MNVLLSAFACAPGLGSEYGQGWGVAQQAARRHDVWVLVDSSFRREIESAPRDKIEFILVEPPFQFNRHRTHIGHGLYYFAWQWQAFKIAKELHRQIRFDLVHHVTFGSAWMPSFMGHLGIPFVIRAGPKERLPAWYFQEMSWGSRGREASRVAGLTAMGPLVERLCTSKASAILTTSARHLWSRDLPVQQFAIGGLTPGEAQRLSSIEPKRHGPFIVATIAGLMGWKGLPLGIKAFSMLSREFPESEYWIIGNGKERCHLEKLTATSPGRIRFLGHLSRDEVFARLAEIDVLLHPALHEEFGFAVLEAMAAGKPVVCMEVAGPSLIVPESAGFLIKPRSKAHVLNDLYSALRICAADPDLCIRMGMAGRAHALRHWSWDNIGDRLLDIYDEVCNRQSHVGYTQYSN